MSAKGTLDINGFFFQLVFVLAFKIKTCSQCGAVQCSVVRCGRVACGAVQCGAVHIVQTCGKSSQ